MLTGTIAPNAAGFNASAEPPETLRLGDANCGGFNAPHRPGYDPFDQLVLSVDGLDFSEAELREVGRRVIDRERQINLEFGRSGAADTLAKRYLDDRLPSRAARGHHVERERFRRMVDEYNAARGWEAEGKLPEARLTKLNSLASDHWPLTTDCFMLETDSWA